jgi:hypothetical protein
MISFSKSADCLHPDIIKVRFIASTEKSHWCQVWWHRPLISALGRQKLEELYLEFEASQFQDSQNNREKSSMGGGGRFQWWLIAATSLELIKCLYIYCLADFYFNSQDRYLVLVLSYVTVIKHRPKQLGGGMGLIWLIGDSLLLKEIQIPRQEFKSGA